MCGRFTITLSKEDLLDYVNQKYNKPIMKDVYTGPNYNVAPGMDILSVIYDGHKHRIGLLNWGFKPDFLPHDKVGFINAKAETLFKLPSFKTAAQKRRCLILSDGFYEWKKDDKTPLRIVTDGGMFAMAGVWNSYQGRDGITHTVAIITTEANEYMKAIHDRMPVILNDEQQQSWLGNDTPIYMLMDLLKPYQGDIRAYEVSHRVGSVKNNDPSLIKDIHTNK